MALPTVKRRDITLEEEEAIEVVGLCESWIHYEWMARLDGWLSTGESVEMQRGGKSSAEALTNLEAAIAEQGWGIE